MGNKDYDIKWRSVDDILPNEGDVILYSVNKNLGLTLVGRYCGKKDPMPSAPDYLPWIQVKYWALIAKPM